jgi:hypothetical protein
LADHFQNLEKFEPFKTIFVKINTHNFTMAKSRPKFGLLLQLKKSVQSNSRPMWSPWRPNCTTSKTWKSLNRNKQ